MRMSERKKTMGMVFVGICVVCGAFLGCANPGLGCSDSDWALVPEKDMPLSCKSPWNTRNPQCVTREQLLGPASEEIDPVFQGATRIVLSLYQYRDTQRALAMVCCFEFPTLRAAEGAMVRSTPYLQELSRTRVFVRLDKSRDNRPTILFVRFEGMDTSQESTAQLLVDLGWDIGDVKLAFSSSSPVVPTEKSSRD
jgi:hypothetical protein